MRAAAISLVRTTIPRSLPKAGRVVDRARARLDSPAIDRDDCATVLGQYDLRVTGAPRNIGYGWRNEIVIVKTSDGTKVLKRYPSRWSEAAVQHEHSILAHLESVAFPAVRLVRRSDGTTSTTHAGVTYVLFEFSSGRNVTGCITSPRQHRRHLACAGSTLARLHRALEGFVPTGVHHLSDHLDGANDRSTLGYRTVLARLVERSHPSSGEVHAQLEWLRGRAGRVHERLEQLDERLGAAPLNRHVIHGDYGLHNLLFRADGTAVVHDFELARVDYRLADLAAVLSRSESHPTSAFVDSYRAESAITGHEWDHLSEVWERHRLCGAVRSWENFSRYGDPRRLHTARRRIDEAATVRTSGVPTCR
ncbi:MAG TPA: phosphotransferase [Acidimicrobiales bacterium]|nr:phosphotransferase [Acidimicrobiales bacterium]